MNFADWLKRIRRVAGRCLPMVMLVSVLLFSIYATPVQAEVITITETGEYVMGEDETVREAKQKAIAIARRQATEKVCVYVKSNTTTNNAQVVQDNIETLSAGLMKDKVTPRSERDARNPMLIRATVVVEIDTDEIPRVLGKLQKDNEREEQLQKVLENQQKLQSELDKLKQERQADRSTGSSSGIDSRVQVGDIIEFGNYQGESIKWRVLAAQGRRRLLITQYGIDAKAYNTEFKEVTWADCTLRQWLNNSFFYNCFSNREREKIACVVNDNSDNPEYGTKGGRQTDDRVFLLSISEVSKYFLNNEDRKCVPTEYCRRNVIKNLREMAVKYNWDFLNKVADLFESRKQQACFWWLRSPGRSDCAARVSYDGSVDFGGNIVNCVSDVVRPALWINL